MRLQYANFVPEDGKQGHSCKAAVGMLKLTCIQKLQLFSLKLKMDRLWSVVLDGLQLGRGT